MSEPSQVPGEFCYWQNLHKPWAQALRRAGRLMLGFDPAPPDRVVRTFAAMYYDADPLAEAFVDEVYLGRSPEEGRALLDRAICGGVESIPDPPESLVRLFADIEEPPSWVDQELVELGARVFRRFGTSVFKFGGTVTLAAYSESSVAKPLALTGAYTGASTRHRFLETAAFWIAVSNPGGLAPGAPGRASALRVRIMHVFVRRKLLAHPEWDLEAWGVPISQADALLTLMGGSFAPAVGLKALGFRPTEREVLALMHFWRYVGHIMGVRPRWYPTSRREAYQLLFVTLVKAAHRAGDDGRDLCKSYIEAFAPAKGDKISLREAIAHRMHVGFSRFFLPPWIYRRNQLPGAGLWRFYPLTLFPLIFTGETLRRSSSVVDELADRVACKQRDRWFTRYMGERTAEYRPAQSFTR